MHRCRCYANIRYRQTHSSEPVLAREPARLFTAWHNSSVTDLNPGGSKQLVLTLDMHRISSGLKYFDRSGSGTDNVLVIKILYWNKYRNSTIAFY